MIRNRHTLTTAISALLLAATTTALAGPTTPPPGPVGQTMKTLAEIEPRIAINSTNTPGDASTLYKISAPGSYYLTGDVVGTAGKHGIRVDANDVTIDLNGFTLRGVSGGNGITDRGDETLPNIANLTVRNGSIVGWASGLRSDFCENARVEGVSFRSNSSAGLSFNGSLVLKDSRAEGGTYGFVCQGSAVVANCIAEDNTTGFDFNHSMITNCVARNNQRGFQVFNSLITESAAYGSAELGLQLGSRSTARDCTIHTAGIGVSMSGVGTTLERCNVLFTTDFGISIGLHDAKVIDCSISNAGSSEFKGGIVVNNGVRRAHIEGNSIVDSPRGILVLGTDCLVIGNRVGRLTSVGNTYYGVIGNRFGPIIQTTSNNTAISVTPSSAGHAGTVTTTDPNANISY